MAVESAPLSTPRVAIIDRHDVVHAGITAWCDDARPPVEIAGCFHSLDEFFGAFPPGAADADAVEVVVLDPNFTGDVPDFQTLRALCERNLRVVVYCDMQADEVILTCLDIGAMTYLVKSEGKDHLIEAIREANSGKAYVGPRMAKALRNDSILGRIKLSEREREVLIAWFQTESKDAVGKRLYIAPTTVRTHLQRARAKYAAVGRPAPTKSALLARAIEDGILSLSDL